MNDAEALQFARRHVETWNSHNLDAIVGLYAESVELVSPVAAALRGSAEVRGRKDLREYFAQGLKKYPGLRFDLVHAFLCESSVTIIYYGPVGKLVAEVMFLGRDRKIEEVYAHYLCAPFDKNST
jgi:SnoaL-like protein